MSGKMRLTKRRRGHGVCNKSYILRILDRCPLLSIFCAHAWQRVNDDLICFQDFASEEGEGGRLLISQNIPNWECTPTFQSAAKLATCSSRFSDRPLAVDSLSGIAPARIAGRSVLEPFAAKPALKLKLRSAPMAIPGFCLVHLRTCGYKSKPRPHFMHAASEATCATRRSPELRSPTQISITSSDCRCYVNCTRCKSTRPVPLAAFSPKTTRCSPCCSAFPIR